MAIPFLSPALIVAVGKYVAEYLGIIESLGFKVDKLIQVELKAGIRNLKQAQNASEETLSLLRDARNHFNKAIELEENARKLIALSGLFLCQIFLKDGQNAINTIDEVSNLDFKLNKLDSAIVNFEEGGGTLGWLVENFGELPAVLIIVNPIGLNLMVWTKSRADYKNNEIKAFNELRNKMIDLFSSIVNDKANNFKLDNNVI